MYGPATTFLLIFSVKNNLVKVSCKSDAQKCQNPYFDQVSESTQPLPLPYPNIPPLLHWGGVLGLPRWFAVLFLPMYARGCKGLPGWFGTLFFHICPFDRGGGFLSDLGNGHIDPTHFKKGLS